MHRNRDPLVAAAGFGERGRCDEEGRHRIGVGLRSSRATIDVEGRFRWATTLRHKIEPSDRLPGNRHRSATGVPIDQ
jgi:hypothetical protein